MKSFSKAAVLVLAAIASPLMATSITYDLNNVTTQDGATIGGMVTYDTVLDSITEANITITDPLIAISSPTLFNEVQYYSNVGGTIFQFGICTANCGANVTIDTTAALGAATITIDPSTSPEGAAAQIYGPRGFSDNITGGTLVGSTATPEPITGALGFLGITGFILWNRYLRGPQAIRNICEGNKQMRRKTLKTHFFHLTSSTSDFRLSRAVQRLGKAAILPSLLVASAAVPAMASSITFVQNGGNVSEIDNLIILGNTYDVFFGEAIDLTFNSTSSADAANLAIDAALNTDSNFQSVGANGNGIDFIVCFEPSFPNNSSCDGSVSVKFQPPFGDWADTGLTIDYEPGSVNPVADFTLVTPTVSTPEPGSLPMLVLGSALILLAAKRKRRSVACSDNPVLLVEPDIPLCR